MNKTVIYRTKILTIILFFLSSLTGKAEKGRFTLFSPETKSLYPSVVYDFLERYLYELDSLQQINPIIQPRLQSDKVVFMKGSPETARHLTPSTPFTIRITENQFYEAIWNDTLQNKLLHLVFPISYELIQGQPKHLIEKTIKKQLMSMDDYFVPDTIPSHEKMKLVEKDIYQPVDIQDLDGIQSLHTGTYYWKTPTNTWRPVFSSNYKMYSAANLLHGVIAECQNYKLHLRQKQYDFQQEEYLISLSQWLNYCKTMHTTVYIGLEEEREDGLKILLIAHSHDLGFQHMLSIILPWNFTEKRNTVIKAQFNAFIPIHNVKSMYMERTINTH